MTTAGSSADPFSEESAPKGRGSTTREEVVDWAKAAPMVVTHETALSKAEADAIWVKIYERVPGAVSSRKLQQEVRAAVYTYCAINGTSRAGTYSSDIKLASGGVLPAEAIVQATTGLKIRKFLRANMEESYKALKNSQYLLSDGKFVMKASTLGIGAEQAFAMADWMTNCPYFTPAELSAHEISMARGLKKAAHSRSGEDLNSIERRLDEDVVTAGTVNGFSGTPVKF